MPLIKLKDFYPNYRQQVLGGDEILGFDVFAGRTDEKIGTVWDDVVDLTGRFRYLVADTSFWGVAKKILLPVASCRLDCRARRVYALSILNKKQVQELPDYADGITVDYDCEERVWGALSAPADTPEPAATGTSQTGTPLWEGNEPEHHTLALHSERLVANKYRREMGVVEIGKRVETKTVRVSVPVEKERIVIERRAPADAGRVIYDGGSAFRSGEVVRIKVCEEITDICKQTFVREVVTVKKQVESHTVDLEATLRREELEVKTDWLQDD